MDEPKDEEKTRQTLSFTHRQLGVGGGLLVAIMSIGKLNDLKEFFAGDTVATIARIEVQQKEGFNRLEKAIKDAQTEDVAMIRRLKDSTWTEIAAAESRCERRNTDLKADLNALQIFAFKSRGHSGSQN